MRGKWVLFAGVVLLGAAGAGAWVWHRKQVPPPPSAQAPAELPAGTEISLEGEIRAVERISIDAPVSGVLEEFAVGPGDEVSEGQVIGRIANDAIREDEVEARLELERAEARARAVEAELTAARLEESRLAAEASRARGELARVEKIYQRQSLLIREGATPRLVFQRAEEDYQQALKERDRVEELLAAAQERVRAVSAEFENARRNVSDKQALLEEARSRLESCNIVAPVDGIVVRIRKSAGETVEQGFQGLVEIAADWTELELVADAPEAYARRLAPGDEARIVLAELPQGALTAQVKSVDKQQVVIAFTSPSTLIRPGMTAVAQLRLR
ncbi:MAG: efflux RND transporter periplasmic adaptor subunit [Bryobacteraceae bacterium]